MSCSAEAVLVFARGGRCEARHKLGRLADREAGVAAASLLLAHSLAVARASGAAVVVAAADDEVAAACPPDACVLPQRGLTFGDRLTRAVADAFDLGFQRVVVVGTDTPALSARACRDALDLLADDTGKPRAVLGPSRDGGFYLLGLSAYDPRIFDGIPWRTRRVLACTRRNLAGYRILTLPPLTDADDEGSLRRALGEAASDPRIARLWRLLVTLVRPARRLVARLPRLLRMWGMAPVRRGPPLPAGSV